MSVQITTAMVKQFSSNVEVLLQQKGSLLRGSVRNESVTGEKAFFDQLGATSATKRTSRYAAMPLMNTPHARRMVLPEDFDWADLVDTLDKAKTLIDPTGKYSQGAAWAMGRAMDDAIIAAFFATAKTGKEGTTDVAFPTTTNQISASTTGLTIAKLISAKEILDGNEVPPENRHIAVTSKQLANLLGTTQVTSSDYNTVKALVQGTLDTFLGFQFHLCNRLALDSSNYRRVPVWWGDAMLLGVGAEPRPETGIRLDIAGAPTQVSYTMSIGATRMQEDGVVEIQCVES